MTEQSLPPNLAKEEEPAPSAPPQPPSGFIEQAWQEKVQREGIRLEREPWYMTFPITLDCRKRKAFYEKAIRECRDPFSAQTARILRDLLQLEEDWIVYRGSGKHIRLSHEARKAREEEFDRKEEVLKQRFHSHLKEGDARNGVSGGHDASEKKLSEEGKLDKETQASESHQIANIFR
ncbi:hypothetical protein ACHAPT_004646 [Fusarium lateritium]